MHDTESCSERGRASSPPSLFFSSRRGVEKDVYVCFCRSVMAVKMGRRVATHRESGMQQHTSVAAPPSALPSTLLPSRFPNISPVPCRRGRVVRMTYRALANAPPFRLAVWRGACHSGLRVEDSEASSGAGGGVSLTASLRLGETSHTG